MYLWVILQGELYVQGGWTQQKEHITVRLSSFMQGVHVQLAQYNIDPHLLVNNLLLYRYNNLQ